MRALSTAAVRALSRAPDRCSCSSRRGPCSAASLPSCFPSFFQVPATVAELSGAGSAASAATPRDSRYVS
ncbi:hypothetical protein [Rhodococcus phenolicus]|uniref:hypothetical protein n=1 Tax=Rhodococcus phenolicus TaxID=263849 RepID=UPI003CCC08C7